MPKTAAQIGRAAHLPHQPRQTFSAGLTARGQEFAEFFRQVHQDCAGLKHPDWLRSAVVDKDGDLGIGVGRDKAAAELVACVDAHQPSIIFRAAVAPGQQFFQHHRDLDAVGCA